jgi:hypothetical protein
MDTSKEYILMCEKATLLQRHIPKKNDCFACFWEDEFNVDPKNKKAVKAAAKEMADDCFEDHRKEGMIKTYEEELQAWIDFYSSGKGNSYDLEIVYAQEDCKCKEDLNEEGYTNKHRFVWLPRQDQLQAMCKDKDIVERLVRKFSLFVLNNNMPPQMDKNNVRFQSMEQLWLAFVMKEKFNKIWNGDDFDEKRINTKGR